jgi:hypothetical protein
MSKIEFILLIFVIGVVFMLNSPSIDENKLKLLIKSIDKELSKEFEKRDKKIKQLEKRIIDLEKGK